MNPQLYERLYGLRTLLLLGLVALVVLCGVSVFAVPQLMNQGTSVASVTRTPVPTWTVPFESPTASPEPSATSVPPSATAPPPPTPTSSPLAPTPTPALPTPTSSPPAPTPTPTSSQGGAPVTRVTVNGVYTVQSGDTLSHIARDLCQSWQHWPEIYQANRDKISDPDLIFPNQKFIIPCE